MAASAALLALASGIALLICTAAGMAGSWSDLDANLFWDVVTDTSFGIVSVIRLVMAAVLAALSLRGGGSSVPVTRMLLSAAFLASIAGTGHAQDGAGAIRVGHVVSDALHLLAAGTWIGGIASLFVLIAPSTGPLRASDTAIAVEASIRFSGLGYIAVATLVGTGLVNSWLLVGSLQALASTGYGRLLCIKLVLFAAMLLLAIFNRFLIVPNLRRSTTVNGTRATLARLRWHVAAELLLGAAVALVVGVLGTIEPAIDAGRV